MAAMEMQTEWMYTVANLATKRYRKYRVYLLISERNWTGETVLDAKPVKVVMNLPKIKSIRGKSVPAAMAAMMATMLRVHVLLSAYLNTRRYGFRPLDSVAVWTSSVVLLFS